MRPSARRVVTQSRAQTLQIWKFALVLIIAAKAAAGQCADGELRLVNGGTQFEGRLEVCLDQQWGTICDDYWKSNAFNAQVACRQLGFSDQGARTRASDPNTFRPPPFGRGTGLIFWDDVRCTGSEQRLEECPHLTTLEGSRDCIHDEDVGVTCQPLPATTPPSHTTTKAIEQPPTHQITEIDINIFIEVDINTTNTDTSVDIDVGSQNTEPDSQDKLKNVTKPISGTKQNSTSATSPVEPRLENEADVQENDYTKLIVISIGVLIVLIGVSMGIMVLLCLLLAAKKGRAAKSGTIETYVDIDNIQDQQNINIHFTVDLSQTTSRIDAGSGKLVPNFSYDLRKAWQRPHKEIEAQANPAYALAPYPGVILQLQEEISPNHHYETVAEATKGTGKVYCNVSSLLQDQNTTAETRPQDYINLH